jgi:hypothetical protein
VTTTAVDQHRRRYLRAVPYRLVRALMIAAGVLYCSLILEVVAGFPLDIHRSFLSELSAQDQATAPYAQAMDLSTGVLLLVTAILARAAARANRDFAGLLISAVLFGAGTILDALSPMDCAPSVSAACQAAETHGQAGADLVLHHVTSAVAGVGTVAMAVFALLVLRRAGWGGAWGRALAVLSGTVVVTQLWLAVHTGLDVVTGAETDAPGVLQRVAILFLCAFLATLPPGLRQAFCR